jgi:hypothetical protein
MFTRIQIKTSDSRMFTCGQHINLSDLDYRIHFLNSSLIHCLLYNYSEPGEAISIFGASLITIRRTS